MQSNLSGAVVESGQLLGLAQNSDLTYSDSAHALAVPIADYFNELLAFPLFPKLF